MRRRGPLVAPVLVSLAGCLLAPGRPSGASDGGPGADDAAPGTCLGASDRGGPTVALDVAGSGYDTVFQLGFYQGSAAVYEFDRPLSETRCPDRIQRLGSSAIVAVDAIAAGILGSELHVIAYVSTSTTDAEVHDLAGSALVDTPQPASGLAPTDVPTNDAGSDHPAFVTIVGIGSSDPEVWFGGGASLALTPVAGAPSGVGSATVTGVTATGSWYGAAVDPHGATTTVALVSDVFIGEAVGSDDSVTVVDPQIAPGCSTAPPCPSAVARGIDHSSAYAGFLVSQRTREIAFSAGTAGRVDQPLASFGPDLPLATRLADAAVDDFTGSGHTDLAMIWAATDGVGSGYVFVAADADGSASVISTPLVVAPSVTHLTAVHAGDTRALLLSSDHPGADDTACVTLQLTDGSTPNTLVPCAP